MFEFPETPGQLAADWLNEALTNAGVLPEGVRVADFVATPVGVGMLGESVRITPKYLPDCDAPASFVAKFASDNPRSRQTGVELGLYRTEVGFYQDMAHTVRVNAPKCYFAEFNAETGAFLLLLEDLAPARVGNQLTGGSVADAEHAMVQAAALHGPRWNDASLREMAWIDRTASQALFGAAIPQVIGAFQSSFETMLEPQHMALCQRFAARSAKFASLKPQNFTIAHMDFRLDNMLFDAQDGRLALAVVDWQTASVHSGALDVAYYMGGGLSRGDRAAHEERLLKLYLQELQAHGVRDYSFDQLWYDYRLYVFHGLAIAIYSAASTKRTARGDAMYLAMTRGCCHQAIDTNALELFENH